jgi:oligopeptide transport system ATP-binding protein
MIAIALSCNPSLLIADEPTTALDVTIQAQIVDLVKRLQREFGMAIIWITHDLGVVAGMVEKVAVMYAGHLVELAEVKDLYRERRHPYTRGLLESIPKLHHDNAARLATIKGLPPDLLNEPASCPFLPRCPFAVERCTEENPPLMPSGRNHYTACWQWEEMNENTRFGKTL